MGITEQLEQRAKTRAACRAVADELVSLIIKRLSEVDESLQQPILSMVQTELQIAQRKEHT